MNKSRTVLFGAAPLKLEDVVDLAEGRAAARLNPDPAFAASIAKGAEFLDRLLEEDGVDRKSTRLNSSHIQKSRMPSSA